MARIITTAEASVRLKLNQASVRKLCAKIGITRIGRDWLLSEEDFERVAAVAKPGPGNPSGKSSKSRK